MDWKHHSDAKPHLLVQEEVVIPAPPVVLLGTLVVPSHARGVILLAHGSGSSRFSPRNRYVAEELLGAGFGTLLLDLLTGEEEAMDSRTGHLRFDIGPLAQRLAAATNWLRSHPATQDLCIGYFGASTGAAAALLAAAERSGEVDAVVSRGGRPDLAGAALSLVQAPTLLIVGCNDEVVLDLNRRALDELTTEKQLVVVQGATHLFEEPGTLEEVARLAANWFTRYLCRVDVTRTCRTKEIRNFVP